MSSEDIDDIAPLPATVAQYESLPGVQKVAEQHKSDWVMAPAAEHAIYLSVKALCSTQLFL